MTPATKVSVVLTAVKSPGCVAVPFAVVANTDTGWAEAADNVTVNVALTVPVLPSVTEASLIDSVGRGTGPSSSTMVATPEKSAMVAPDGRLKLAVKVSFASLTVSPRTGTVTV